MSQELPDPRRQIAYILLAVAITIPGVAIRTSMIVGFPGETAADFEELCQFVQAAQFDRLGVFSYSDEETSASYHLDQKVDGRTIYNRKRRLMSIQRKISRARNRMLAGREVPVLVEGSSAETDLLWQARTAAQAPETVPIEQAEESGGVADSSSTPRVLGGAMQGRRKPRW